MTARVLVVEQEAAAGIGTLGPRLRQTGIRLEICRAHAGESLPGEIGFDGLVVLGGPMGAHEDGSAPWLPATRALLRRATETSTPVLGICLGAQFLAIACGGRVEPGAAGSEIGVTPVTIDAPNDPLLRGLPSPARVMQWHDDVTTCLPAGGESLAHSATYPHQVFRVGHRAWGVGFHPEVTLASLTAWAEMTGLCSKQAAAVIHGARDRTLELAEASRIIAANFASIVLEGAS
jgi:GMP synthase (glutamine-hydrolysing)